MSEAPRVLVDSGAPPNPLTQVVSYDSLYDYLTSFAHGELFRDVDLEELIEEKIPGQDDPAGPGRTPNGRPIRVIPNYELRYKAMKFSHSGLIAKCTPRELAMAVRAAYNHTLQRLHGEQPQAQWRLVASHVRRDQVNRQFDATGNVEAVPEYNLAQLVNEAEHSAMRVGRGGSAQGLARTNGTVMSSTSTKPDFRALLCCVFADVGKAEMVDPVSSRWPGEVGPMHRYAERNELRYLPSNLRRERTVAKAIISRLIEKGAEEPEVLSEDVELEITPERVRGMTILRQQGMGWGDVGKMFGVSWQSARSAVLRENSNEDPLGDAGDDAA